MKKCLSAILHKVRCHSTELFHWSPLPLCILHGICEQPHVRTERHVSTIQSASDALGVTYRINLIAECQGLSCASRPAACNLTWCSYI